MTTNVLPCPYGTRKIATTMLPAEDMRRYARAAQAIGDYPNVEKIAEELARRDSRLGLHALRRIWQTGRANATERRELAEVCGVPLWFLTDGLPDERASENELEATVLRLAGEIEQIKLLLARAGLRRARATRPVSPTEAPPKTDTTDPHDQHGEDAR